MPEHIKNLFHTKIRSLLPDNAFTDEPEHIALELENEAYTVWLEFAGEVEKELSPGGKFEGMNDWGGKLPGAVARIAGLFHLVPMNALKRPK